MQVQDNLKLAKLHLISWTWYNLVSDQHMKGLGDMIDGLLPPGMINRETFLSLTSLSHLTSVKFPKQCFHIEVHWKNVLEKGSKGQSWCCLAFKCSHKMIETHISNLSPYKVYTTSVHTAQNLESGSRSELKNSLLKLKPKMVSDDTDEERKAL